EDAVLVERALVLVAGNDKEPLHHAGEHAVHVLVIGAKRFAKIWRERGYRRGVLVVVSRGAEVSLPVTQSTTRLAALRQEVLADALEECLCHRRGRRRLAQKLVEIAD